MTARRAVDTLTDHERAELSRAAVDLYANGVNRAGHLLSVVSAVGRADDAGRLAQFTLARQVYAGWLALGWQRAAEIMEGVKP